jgi:hypothetical protein
MASYDISTDLLFKTLKHKTMLYCIYIPTLMSDLWQNDPRYDCFKVVEWKRESSVLHFMLSKSLKNNSEIEYSLSVDRMVSVR